MPENAQRRCSDNLHNIDRLSDAPSVFSFIFVKKYTEYLPVLLTLEMFSSRGATNEAEACPRRSDLKIVDSRAAFEKYIVR